MEPNNKKFIESIKKAISPVDLKDRRVIPEDPSGLGIDWSVLHEEMMRLSCAYFAQETLEGAEEYGGRFFINEHHQEWDELVQTHKRLCVLASRDSGKTFFFDYAYPIWKAVTHPGSKTFIFSATSPQAERILEDIKDQFETNPKLSHLVPTGTNKKWASKYIKLTNGSRIYARGYGSKVRGGHPNYIIVDDGLNDECMYSETVREKNIDYFLSAITNMCVPGGQIIVVGTPFHASDLYGYLGTNEEYHWQKFPAWDANKKPLWEERYPLYRLEAKRREIGSIRFTREFMCDPISDDMSLFPSTLFRGDPIEQPYSIGSPRDWWLSTTNVKSFYMGVDFAMSSTVQADYTVLFTIGVDDDGNRWIVNIIREKGLPYQDQLSLIKSEAVKYDHDLILLESNQMQRIFGDELIRTTDLPIKKFQTSVEKNSLEKGVPALRVLLENHKFRIPRGDAKSIEITDKWIAEMNAFTWVKGKLGGVGAHDDLVMALYFANEAIKLGGFSFTFGDDVSPLTPEDSLKKEGNPLDAKKLGLGTNIPGLGFY